MKIVWIILLAFFVSCTSVPKQPFVQIKPVPENHPWWLRVEYFPSGKNIHNIPISKINKAWCFANAFSPEDYASVLSNDDFDTLKKREAIAFELNGLFDGRRNLKAITGVYQKCSGEKGNFVMLVDASTHNYELVSVLEVNPNKASFMVLISEPDNMLGVGWCFDCDDIELLKWDEPTNNLKWQELSEENE